MVTFYNPAKVLLYLKELKEKIPVFMEIDPSYLCNHACLWCRYHHPNGVLPLDYMVALLDKYPQVRGVRITGGGEPLINPATPQFILECSQRGIKTGIETNGGLLRKDSIEIIGNNCQYCRISLDAATIETHRRLHGSKGDFERILDNVRALRETKLAELGISYLVVDENVDEITHLAELNLPVSYIHFKPIIQGVNRQTQKKALKAIKALEQQVSYPLIYGRLVQDHFHRPGLKCRVTALFTRAAADGKEYVCCEHVGEEAFLRENWDGSTERCASCRYAPYNEVLEIYYTNTLSHEFL
ncbi:MAG: radical SAM protein [Chloroflexi bacterium]|nr:radical SAM protein [Chloroflexota bacterium]